MRTNTQHVILRGFFLAVLVWGHGVASAQPSNPDSALVVVLQHMEGTPLLLEEALAMAMARATPIAIAQFESDAAVGALRREEGAFDPEIYSTIEQRRDELPSASPFSGADVVVNDATNARSGIRNTFATGTEVDLSLNATRTETNSRFSALDPQYDTFGALRVRHPLLAGSRVSAKEERLSAQFAVDAAAARVEDAIVATESDVTETYWELYAAERDYAVQVVIRDGARAVLEEAQLRASAGLIGPSQVENARVFLAEQQLALLDRGEDLDGVSDRLATMIGTRPPAGSERFRPASDPPSLFTADRVDSLVQRALDANLALQSLKINIEDLRMRARAGRRDRLPTVDLIGGLTARGLSGQAQDVIFGSDTLRTGSGGDVAKALRQIATLDFPSWNVGIDITIPIGNRRKGGEYDRLTAEVRRAEQEYIAEARSLEAAVRIRHRELQNGPRRLEFAEGGVAASLEQIRIGLIEFRNGRITAFELVRLGGDLASAQQRYSDALVRNARAAAALTRLTSGAYHP